MVPEKYITQLIQDINAAHKKPNDSSSDDSSPLNDHDEGIAAHFREVENYLEFDYENEPTFGQIVNLEAISFPKAELLNDDQLQKLLSAFNELLASYNVSLDIPKEIAPNTKYSISIGVLDEAIFLSDEGHTGWDFCSSEPESCPYGEHCYCIEIDAEFERNIKEAEEFLIDIIESCEDRIQQFGQMELKTGNTAEDTFDKLCMFIAGGNDYVHFEIYQNALELQKACALLQKLFLDDPDIVSLFDDLGKMIVHKNLELLFSLKVEKMEGNTLYVEPYYIEDGLIYKGHAKLYTPEELMDKLESEEEDEK